MNKYVELCKGLPSNALQAMIDGLKASQKLEGFEVDMDTYGTVEFDDEDNSICFGCAATCTMGQLTNLDDLENPYWAVYSTEELDWDIEDFEITINQARSGNFSSLFGLFGIPYPTEVKLISREWADTGGMHTHDWKKKLPLAQALVDKLKGLGY